MSSKIGRKYHSFVVNLLTAMVIIAVFCVNGYSQSERSISLTQAIRKISFKTPYRFLYRESFTNTIRVSDNRNADSLLNKLKKALPEIGVEFLVDTTYHHILVFERKVGTYSVRNIFIQFFDDETGERVPFGHLYFPQNKILKADEFGRIQIRFSEMDTTSLLGISALGYQTTSINLPTQKGSFEINVRLNKLYFEGEEIVVIDESESTNKFLKNKMNTGFSAGGEWSIIRSSQQLPSVFSQNALDRHMIVRGGTPDGVTVQLDGVTQFEPTHLFGMIDSYTNDILQYSELMYAHIPGQIGATNGGVYDLRTRSGNRNEMYSQFALSNTAFRGSLDGPLPGNAGTWTIGGKTGIVNQLNILGNEERIAWGLDTGRDVRVTDTRFVPTTTDLVQTENPSVQFYDLQGKIQLENRDGSTIQISGYIGGDDINQTGQRITQVTTSTLENQIELVPIETKNKWNQSQIGTTYWTNWGNWLFQSSLNYAFYESEYLKDDFTYLYSQPQEDALIRSYIEQFYQKNQFSELKAQFMMNRGFGSSYHLDFGIHATRYIMSYEEESFSYPYFSAYYQTVLIEPFIQQKIQFTRLTILADLRSHFATDGNIFRLSPRLTAKMTLLPNLKWDVGAVHGYQFLNRLSLYNSVANDVWVPATENQPPVQLNHAFTSLNWQPFSNSTITVSGYYKYLDNVRMHEINTRNYTTSFNPEPWFSNHHLRSYGFEAFSANQLGPTSTQISYTWSVTDLKNSEINNGSYFPAYWDRRHQFKLSEQIEFSSEISLNFNGIVATGIPAREPGSTGLIPERLDLYRRLDAGFQYKKRGTGLNYQITFQVYNILNLKNAWYRDEIQAIDSEGDGTSLISVQADILDLGFMPSLEFKISF